MDKYIWVQELIFHLSRDVSLGRLCSNFLMVSATTTANSLHQAGNEKYEDLINGITTLLSRQWARNMSSEDVSKDDRYVLRLATLLHVPYDRFPWLLISQDDHLTAGTWTACECGAIDAKDSHNQSFLVSCPSRRWILEGLKNSAG